MTRTIMIHGDDEHFTPDQLIAAELLSQPGRNGLTMAEVAQRANTSERSLQRWRRDGRFADFVKRRTLENTTEHLADVLGTLTTLAKRGHSMKAVELYLRATGLLNQEITVRPTAPVEDRSTEALERSIEELRRQLEADGFISEEE
jgi:AcrR family transcriptional regulator